MAEVGPQITKKYVSLAIFLIGTVGETLITKKVTLNASFPAALSLLTAFTGVVIYTAIVAVAWCAGWKRREELTVPWKVPAVVAVLFALHHTLLNVGAGSQLVPGILVVVLVKAVVPMSMLLSMPERTLGLRYGRTHWLSLCLLLAGIAATVRGETLKEGSEGASTPQLLFFSLLIVLSTLPLAASFTYIEITLTQHHKDLFTVALWAWICWFQFAMTIVFLPLSAVLTHLNFSKIGANLKAGVECYLLGSSDGSSQGEGCPEAAKYWYAAIVFALMFNLAMPICTKLAGATMMWFVRAMAIPLCGMMFASKIIMGDNANPPNANQAVGLALVATGIFIYNMEKPGKRQKTLPDAFPDNQEPLIKA